MEPDWVEVDSSDPSQYQWREGEPCPICEDGEVRARTSTFTGEAFAGCSNYPTCRFQGELLGRTGPTKFSESTGHRKDDSLPTF